MMIDVIGVRPLGSYKLEIEFSDGTVGVRDFGSVTAKRSKSWQNPDTLGDPGPILPVSSIYDGALTRAKTATSGFRLRFTVK